MLLVTQLELAFSNFLTSAFEYFAQTFGSEAPTEIFFY
jgi:hypothetical protein